MGAGTTRRRRPSSSIATCLAMRLPARDRASSQESKGSEATLLAVDLCGCCNVLALPIWYQYTRPRRWPLCESVQNAIRRWLCVDQCPAGGTHESGYSFSAHWLMPRRSCAIAVWFAQPLKFALCPAGQTPSIIIQISNAGQPIRFRRAVTSRYHSEHCAK